MNRRARRLLSPAWAWAWAWAAMVAFGLVGCVAPTREIPPAGGYAEVVELLQSFIERELRDKGLHALSIACIDGDDVAWSKGFGLADPAARVPATPWTVYRVGAVAQLFTAVAIMQKVEAGRLDLDAPVTRYLPDLVFDNRFGGELTLRHFLSHRAGIPREPPLGNKVDPTSVTLGETVHSLRGTSLVYPPGSRFKYSNAGLAVVGRALEAVTNRRFQDHMQEAVIEPAGLTASNFIPTAPLRRWIAKGTMWTRTGEEFAAPVFEPGMQPATNLYASVLDLARFATQTFDRPPTRPLVSRATMRAMFAPQFVAGTGPGSTPGTAPGSAPGTALGSTSDTTPGTAPGTTLGTTPGPSPGTGPAPLPESAALAGGAAGSSVALGVFRSQLDGELVVFHGGAIHGFATSLLSMPGQGFAVAVVNTHDGATAVSDRIARYALQLMLARRRGQALPRLEPTLPVGSVRAAELAGWYSSGAAHCRLFARGGELILEPPAGFEQTLRVRGAGLIVDDRLSHGAEVRADGQTLVVGGRTFTRVPDFHPPELPSAQREYLGDYGWPHDVLSVFERAGQLHILIDWFAHYRIEPVGSAGATAQRPSSGTPGSAGRRSATGSGNADGSNRRDRFRLPDSGRYAGEAVGFRRAADGRVDGVWVGGVLYRRR